MERRVWLGSAALLLLLGSACTANGPLVRASASPSPSAASPLASPVPSPSAAASPTPVPVSVACQETVSASSEPLVIELTPNHDGLELDSVHDPVNPGLMCSLQGGAFRFISATEIGYATSSSLNDPINGTSTIGRIDLADMHHPLAVATVQGAVLDFAWSPDGTSVAYLLYTSAPGLGSGAANQLWLKTGDAQPRALTPLIPLFGRGGSISDETIVRFSPDGKYLVMVDTYVDGPAPVSPDQAHFQVRAMPAGNLVWVPPTALTAGDKIGASFVTMATWSRTGDRLYYRDAAGVQSWDPPSTVTTIAAGLAWFSPMVSPDGKLVAYTVNLDAQPHVEVRDLVTNEVRILPGIRGAPFFVSSTALIVAVYEPSKQQGPGALPYAQTGAVLYDLNTGVETSLFWVINPIDYWPR
jgi:hypothetical protein